VPVTSIDQLPGFRRRFRITPGDGWVRAELEDDYHCMGLVVHHADGVATRLDPVMERAPWTTCPGAVAQVGSTFAGQPLAAFARCGQKTRNCTHLYDLALLAAAHAGDPETLVYDILVSDPVDGERRAELRRDGETVMAWALRGMRLLAPAQLAGLELFAMQAWIQTLEPAAQEAARLLRWGSMIANGRTIPLDEQSDASRMPPNCHTFQPENAARARRVGQSKDFSEGPEEPLGSRGTTL